MRVRPLFWCILALSCVSVLILAATVRTHAPARMQVRLEQPLPGSVGFTTLKLHLADTQGLPIDQAQVIPRAWMTNMDMQTHQVTVKALGGETTRHNCDCTWLVPGRLTWWHMRMISSPSNRRSLSRWNED